MKILIVSPCSTHPPTLGNRRRILALAEAIAAHGNEVHFALLPTAHFQLGDVDEMRRFWGPRLHVLSSTRKRNAGSRLRRTLAALLLPMRRRAARLAAKPVPTPIDKHYFSWWDFALLALQRRHRFDMVIVEYVFFSRALLCFPEGVRKVIDTHDIFSNRNASIARVTTRTQRFLDTDPVSEALGLSRADLVIGIQEEETSSLARMTMRPVVTIGHINEHDTPFHPPREPCSQRVLLVGADNVMNIAGCEWFIDNVLGRVVERFPQLRFRVCGRVGLGIAERCRAVDGVDIAGLVDDLEAEYAAADVVVNPVLGGTGVAIKAIEALARGKPLVCTTPGARGLLVAGFPTQPCVVVDEPEALADALVGLLEDPIARRHLSTQAIAFTSAWNDRNARNLAVVLDQAPPEHVAS